MVLVNSGLPHAKDSLLKLLANWAWALKNFRQPHSRPKKFKDYRFYTSRAGREVIPKCILK
jgi:hypothetical protein